MKNIELISPGAMSGAGRAGEIVAIVAAVLIRSQAVDKTHTASLKDKLNLACARQEAFIQLPINRSLCDE